MVASSAVVGSSAISRPRARQRHGDHHALALAARAGAGWRGGADPECGQVEQRISTARHRLVREDRPWWRCSRLGDLRRRCTGLSGHGLLEHHGDLVCRGSRICASRRRAQVLALEADRALDDAPGLRCRPRRISDSAVTDLPQPISPTTAQRLAGLTQRQAPQRRAPGRPRVKNRMVRLSIRG